MDDQQPNPTPEPTPATPPPTSPPALSPETLQALGIGPSSQASEPEPEPNSGGFAGGIFGIGLAIGAGILNWILIPIAIVFILHNFVFQAFHVVGSSMVPTLHDADYLIISKVDNSLAKLQRKSYIPGRYQVLVFHYPKDPALVFVKRVIGLPGDRVVVHGGKITVHPSGGGASFDPDASGKYTPSEANTQGEYDDIVQPGNVFVVGDNRSPNGSFDSREWGPLPASYIVGNAVVRLLPLDAFKFLALPQLAL